MHPVLLRIPVVDLPIYSYGVMLGLSLVVGWYIVLGLCERDGMDREKMGRLYVWTAACSVAGSRLLYVLTNLDRFDSFIDVFKVNQGGLVAYGGFIGGFLCGIVYCRVHKIRLLSWADCVVPSLGTGLAITRIGCFLYGLSLGNMVTIPGLIVQQEFAAAHFARVVSLVVAINQFTFAFGPGLLGWLRQAEGDYRVGFLACLAMQLAAALIVMAPRLVPRRGGRPA